jgi:hypothetical protein
MKDVFIAFVIAFCFNLMPANLNPHWNWQYSIFFILVTTLCATYPVILARNKIRDGAY